MSEHADQGEIRNWKDGLTHPRGGQNQVAGMQKEIPVYANAGKVSGAGTQTTIGPESAKGGEPEKGDQEVRGWRSGGRDAGSMGGVSEAV